MEELIKEVESLDGKTIGDVDMFGVVKDGKVEIGADFTFKNSSLAEAFDRNLSDLKKANAIMEDVAKRYSDSVMEKVLFTEERVESLGLGFRTYEQSMEALVVLSI
jgi:hypothetical protein